MGDPAKTGKAVLKLVAAKNRPTHLLLGNDTLTLVSEELIRFRSEIAEWKTLSRSTHFEV